MVITLHVFSKNVLIKKDGEKGIVSLATDSCSVFVSNGTYYDYSDSDNSEMLGYFGIDSQKIFDLTQGSD